MKIASRLRRLERLPKKQIWLTGFIYSPAGVPHGVVVREQKELLLSWLNDPASLSNPFVNFIKCDAFLTLEADYLLLKKCYQAAIDLLEDTTFALQ